MVGTMDSDLAVQIIYADQIKGADAEKIKEEKKKEYDALCQSAHSAAKRGYVGNPAQTSALRF